MPRIAEETIQRVAEANDIVEVIQNYFPLKRAGAMWRALCPFHREKTPSFNVNPQRQTYKCFGCGAGGDVIRFVREYEHLEFVEAVRKLAQRAGIPIVEEAGGPEDDKRHHLRKRLLTLHVEAAAWFHHNLLRMPSAKVARDYLKSRGIGVEVAKSWQLGFAPDSWDALLDFLREKKFSPEEIAQSGLASSRGEIENQKSKIENLYSRFRARVMFPIRNDYGEVIAFSGRVLDPEAKTAKYVNSPETPLFTKGKVLFGLDKSKRALIEAKTAIVCEGQLDLISAFESGVQNVIAPQGTAFTPDQARVLQRFVETVVLCFDSDRAGQEAVTKSLPSLLDHGLEVKVARLPEGEDPDSLIRGQGPAAFRTVVDASKNFFDHALEILAERGTLDDPTGKSAAARRLGPYLSHIKDQVLYHATVDKLSARLNVPRSAIDQYVKSSTGRQVVENESSGTKSLDEFSTPIQKSAEILCALALSDPESREWMKNQKDIFSLSEFQNSTFWSLLEKLIKSEVPLERPSYLATFTASLESKEEHALAQLNLKFLPENPLQATQDTWRGIVAQQIEQQAIAIQSANADSKLPAQDRTRLQMRLLQEKLKATEVLLEGQGHNMSLQERSGMKSTIEELTKQILDLQSRLNEI